MDFHRTTIALSVRSLVCLCCFNRRSFVRSFIRFVRLLFVCLFVRLLVRWSVSPVIGELLAVSALRRAVVVFVLCRRRCCVVVFVFEMCCLTLADMLTCCLLPRVWICGTRQTARTARRAREVVCGVSSTTDCLGGQVRKHCPKHPAAETPTLTIVSNFKEQFLNCQSSSSIPKTGETCATWIKPGCQAHTVTGTADSELHATILGVGLLTQRRGHTTTKPRAKHLSQNTVLILQTAMHTRSPSSSSFMEEFTSGTPPLPHPESDQRAAPIKVVICQKGP